MSARIRLALVLLLALVLQTSVLQRFDVAGVIPDVMLLVAVAAGIVGGPERGALAGFAAGIAIDLYLQTPLGLSALVFGLVGHAVGLLSQGTVRAAWWIPVLTAMVASAVGVVLFAVAGSLVGRPDLLAPRVALVAAVVAVLNGAASPLALRAVGWAMAGSAEGR